MNENDKIGNKDNIIELNIENINPVIAKAGGGDPGMAGYYEKDI